MALISCPAVQGYLNNKCASASNVRTAVGLLQAVTSDINTEGVEVLQDISKDGRKKTVQLVYAQRALSSEVSVTPITNWCAATTRREERSISLTPNLSFSISRLFTEAELALICDPAETVIKNEISLLFDALNTRINDALLAFVQANPGGLYGGGATAATDFIVGAAPNDAVNTGHLDRVLDNLADIGCGGRPILVGSGELAQMARRLNYGCCNTNQGVDYTKVGDEFWFFKDRNAATILGLNRFIAFVPGAIQILPYLKNSGSMATHGVESPGDERNVIYDPLSNMYWDYTVAYDKCSRGYNITLEVEMAFFINPADRFKVGDPLVGTNGVLIYNQT